MSMQCLCTLTSLESDTVCKALVENNAVEAVLAHLRRCQTEAQAQAGWLLHHVL